jgi:hypothetical protein
MYCGIDKSLFINKSIPPSLFNMILFSANLAYIFLYGISFSVFLGLLEM